MKIREGRHSVARQEALAKVTGEAKYVNNLKFQEIPHVQTVRSPLGMREFSPSILQRQWSIQM